MGRPNVPLDAPTGKMHRRLLAEAINRILVGQMNVTSTVTLTPSADSTALTDSRISVSTVAGASPSTADAAAEIGNGTMYWVCTDGTLTITHANNAKTDRVFNITLIG